VASLLLRQRKNSGTEIFRPTLDLVHPDLRGFNIWVNWLKLWIEKRSFGKKSFL